MTDSIAYSFVVQIFVEHSNIYCACNAPQWDPDSELKPIRANMAQSAVTILAMNWEIPTQKVLTTKSYIIEMKDD